MKEKEKKAKKFLLSLKETSLIYHGDSDGLCSAVLVSKFLKEKVKMASPNDSYGIQITENLLEDINNFPCGVFVDLAVDQWDFEKIKPKVLVIDHHTPQRDLNRIKKFIHINPRLENKKVYFPASYLVFKLLCELDKNMKKYSWIAAVGVIGDKGDLKKIKFKEKYEDLKFLSDVIEACKGIDGYRGIVKAYEVFSQAERPEEIMNSKLVRTYHKFQEEIDKTILDFRYHAEYFEKTKSYLYKVYNKYNITSSVSTILSEEKPDTAFFIYKKNKTLSMSARCQTGRINLAELFQKICEGIGTGGGHPQAAAANIPKENEDKFLERLRNYLEGI